MYAHSHTESEKEIQYHEKVDVVPKKGHVKDGESDELTHATLSEILGAESHPTKVAEKGREQEAVEKRDPDGVDVSFRHGAGHLEHTLGSILNKSDFVVWRKVPVYVHHPFKRFFFPKN